MSTPTYTPRFELHETAESCTCEPRWDIIGLDPRDPDDHFPTCPHYIEPDDAPVPMEYNDFAELGL
jgi:hypothetical protein